MWPSHKPECNKQKEKAKAKKKNLTTASAKDKAAKVKKNEAKDLIGDVWNARDRYVKGTD